MAVIRAVCGDQPQMMGLRKGTDVCQPPPGPPAGLYRQKRRQVISCRFWSWMQPNRMLDLGFAE